MAVMDEFQEEREALKHGTPQQKLQYFWDYYKWHTIVAILVITAIVYVIHFYATRKEEMFCGAILNCYALENADAYNQGFVSYCGYDPEDYSAFIDSTVNVNFEEFDANSSASAEKLSMYIAANQLDVIVAEEDIFSHYAYGGVFNDIRTALTEEEVAEYESRFYYVDLPLVEATYKAEMEFDTTFQPTLPDPDRPELMEEPIPVGIYVDDSKGLSENYLFREEGKAVFGIVSNAPDRELSIKYLEYLLQ